MKYRLYQAIVFLAAAVNSIESVLNSWNLSNSVTIILWLGHRRP